MLLTGAFRRSLDEKGRVAIPRRMRTALANTETVTVYMAPGTDGCLAVYSEAEFKVLGDRLGTASPTGSDVRAFSRLFYARAQSLEVDSQGRMRIPPELMQIAGLQGEVMIVGVRDHLEVWDLGRWEKYMGAQQEHYDEIAERAFRDGNR